jgi:phytoene synthase
MIDERNAIRTHSKSFALAARLLSPVARRRAERLYAWCRYADDAIDHAPTPRDALAALAVLRADLDSVYSGRRPNAPASELLALVVADCRLPQQYPEQLLAGLAMDADGTRYRTLGDLLLYCHRVAGVVGLMMCQALGVSDERAGWHAGQLGIAMQLTNVSRDVAEDWARGRLYLPMDWMAMEPTVGEPLQDSAVAGAIERLLDVADEHYAAGDAGMKYLDRRSRFAVQVARLAYSRIGTQIRAAGCRPSAGRAVVSCRRKLMAVGLASRELFSASGSPVHPPRTIWEYRPAIGYVPAEAVAAGTTRTAL